MMSSVGNKMDQGRAKGWGEIEDECIYREKRELNIISNFLKYHCLN